MDKIKILVAQHKEADVYSNKVYTPIQPSYMYMSKYQLFVVNTVEKWLVF